jgi:hypothetical protein
VTVFEDARGPNVRELRQAQRRLSPAELEALIADYEAGGRVGELAKVNGLHRTTVARHVARAGKTRPVMTAAQVDEAIFCIGTGGHFTTWDSTWAWQIRRSGGCW